MRKLRGRLLRGVTAAALAVTVALPIGARPAQAVDPGTVVAAIRTAYGIWQGYKAGGALADAIRGILLTIQQAKFEIIAQIDRVAAAEARACANHAVIDFADIERFSDDTLQAYARDATGCVTWIESLLRVSVDAAATDQLGFALNAVGPLALAARARAGFSTTDLVSTLRAGNNTLIGKIDASCYEIPLTEALPPAPINAVVDIVITLRCEVYNGDVGYDAGTYQILWQGYYDRGWLLSPLDFTFAKELASVKTSRPAAFAALASL